MDITLCSCLSMSLLFAQQKLIKLILKLEFHLTIIKLRSSDRSYFIW